MSGLQTEPLTHPGDCWWFVEVQTKGKDRDLMLYWRGKNSNADRYNKAGIVLSIEAPHVDQLKFTIEDLNKGRFYHTKSPPPYDRPDYRF